MGSTWAVEIEWTMRAKLLDEKGKKITMKKVLKTENGKRFSELYSEEFDRLIEVQNVMHPIAKSRRDTRRRTERRNCLSMITKIRRELDSWQEEIIYSMKEMYQLG